LWLLPLLWLLLLLLPLPLFHVPILPAMVAAGTKRHWLEAKMCDCMIALSLLEKLRSNHDGVIINNLK